MTDPHSPEPSLKQTPQTGSQSERDSNRLSEVRSACLSCVTCGLSRTRTRVVFGEGNPRSPLVIVGEGPGEQEDASGRPFVGRAGQLLEAALRENGILRQHVYITNVLKCRACVVNGRKVSNRPPHPDEVEACRPWLSAELSSVNPLVIVCLGAPAASWIIHPEFRILRERGQWFPTPWSRLAMATLHPAYVLRQEGRAYDESRATLVRDIGQARRKVIELRKQAAQSIAPAEGCEASEGSESAPASPPGGISAAEPRPRQGSLPL
ncbi:MAG: uracil-DNA glycosylase [Chloroflexi bacterium]|nr:uracil-DNA glycosylase [Chloroflexota bacterium]